MVKKITLFSLLVLVLTACHKNTNTITPTPITRRIIAITSANGIGDQGYLDVVVLGFEQVYASLDNSTYMHICTPFTTDEAYQIARSSIEKANDGIPTLIIFGSAEFLSVVDSLHSDASISGSNISLLLFESDSLGQAANNLDYHSFIISTYKACYNAGNYVATTGFKRPLIWLSTPIDVQMDYFRDGFSDGFYDVTGVRPDVKYLADDWKAYNMADSAYRAMFSLSEEYDFIFPVIGGSNLGIFRYLRENPDGPYVAGMDVDQSRYAENIIGSIIKHIDAAVVDYTNAWLSGEKIPSHQVFDASSGYIEWRVTREVQPNRHYCYE